MREASYTNKIEKAPPCFINIFKHHAVAFSSSHIFRRARSLAEHYAVQLCQDIYQCLRSYPFVESPAEGTLGMNIWPLHATTDSEMGPSCTLYIYANQSPRHRPRRNASVA